MILSGYVKTRKQFDVINRETCDFFHNIYIPSFLCLPFILTTPGKMRTFVIPAAGFLIKIPLIGFSVPYRLKFPAYLTAAVQ